MSNLEAFLSMIAVSEGTSTCPETKDSGYDILVGGTRFTDKQEVPYSDHPRILVDLGNDLTSTAAGRYQILERYYDAYATQLNLPDFGHTSQDAIAVQMITECNAIEDINSGELQSAITKCSSRWASLPGNNYGQHQQEYDMLAQAFSNSGGIIA